jgi:hypothetical protein
MNKRMITQVFGVVLLLVGVLGFVPALTPDGKLLGIFQVDFLHNLVHIVSGAAALYLAMSMGEKGAVLFGKVFSVVYGLVTVLGLLTGNALGVAIPVNLADNGLHIALTAVFAYVGYMKS